MWYIRNEVNKVKPDVIYARRKERLVTLFPCGAFFNFPSQPKVGRKCTVPKRWPHWINRQYCIQPQPVRRHYPACALGRTLRHVLPAMGQRWSCTRPCSRSPRRCSTTSSSHHLGGSDFCCTSTYWECCSHRPTFTRKNGHGRVGTPDKRRGWTGIPPACLACGAITKPL